MKKSLSDKDVRTLLLKWLFKQFGNNDHTPSFKDGWILPNITFNNRLSVSFDSRVEEQMELIKMIPPQFMGTPQKRTLLIVNPQTFYLDLNDLLDLKYPSIVDYRLVKTNTHKGGKGGWSSPSDEFQSYDWELMLSDGTMMDHNNQSKTIDIAALETSWIYRSRIEEREFIKFLESQDYEEKDKSS